ncbi:MAG: DUF1365 domain-containing protein [Actinomycetota bacterium]|nr:DUF1365 domain-containing protein [Actinomycetota bacterium]MDH5224548.1 DUF1365 domain-containing protein [Actinomycetota bacterium]MDH5313175.1 DUF1365 domain-containing protein [Actinomycetota bacterium]
MAEHSGLYLGAVTHTRHFPTKHRLSYGVWYMLLDLDELDELDATVPGFSVDRPGPISFHARDHGPRDGSALRPWIESHLRAANIDIAGGPIRILCFPRVLGYVFNPISVWFCHHPSGELAAILYEVSNTFGEGHAYLIPAEPGTGAGDIVARSFAKELFVSPFIDQAARYEFRTRVPDGRASVAVRETVREGKVLDAALTARRVTLDGPNLASAFLRYPLLTLKVIGGIHWEAIKLWLKGAPYRRREAPPAHPVTTVPVPPEPGNVAVA